MCLQQFTCEICGGAEYWGRRAFERHFKEWRHQNGMRALGIPNNKNFFEVTQISDARELWTSIQVPSGPVTTSKTGMLWKPSKCLAICDYLHT